MRYFKKTAEYLFKLEKGKRFLLLFLMSLPIGIAIAAANPVGALFDWLAGYETGNDSFAAAWTFGGTIPAVPTGIAIAAAFVLMLFFMSVSVTVISRSLRVGVFKVNGIFRDFNENFIPVLQAVFCYSVAALLIKVLTTALIILPQGISNAALSATISAALLVGAYAAVALIMSIGILYLPYMTFNGLNSFHAYTAASSAVSGKTFPRMFGAVAVPLAVCLAVSFAVGAAGSRLASFIVEAVLDSALIVYFITLAFISYYEILGLVREDFPKDYFYYKPRRKDK